MAKHCRVSVSSETQINIKVVKQVILEANSFDDIAWPTTCARCGQEIASQQAEIKEIDIQKGFWASSQKTPAKLSIRICKRKSCRRSPTASFFIYVLSILIFSATIALIIYFIKHEINAWVFIIFGFSIAYKIFTSGPTDCTCIRKSKTKWSFKFDNDAFAGQFEELNDKDKRQQAQEQRRAKEFQRQQEKAEYEQEQQRAEEEKQRKYEQAEQETANDNARQTIKDERYYGKVLGLKGRITKEDVKCRYRELCQQYHPDRVNHAGPKIKEVAEKEMKAINEAYAYFEKKYGV